MKWRLITPNPVQVAVNVSSIQFARRTFVEEVAETLRRTGLNPSHLQLELTESVMIAGVDSSVETMKRLKDMGVSFAIDDFGTGYSCLSYLPALPFDALKIDRSFVTASHLSPERRMLLESLISLAQNIGLRVIVEGVETADQLDMIRKLGGNEIQGYLLGRPTSDPISKISSIFKNEETPVASFVPTLNLKPMLNTEISEAVSSPS